MSRNRIKNFETTHRSASEQPSGISRPLVGDLLRRLALKHKLVKKKWIKEWYTELGPVGAARQVGYALWYHSVPEDDDTRELRRQLKYLEEHGYWEAV